MRRLLRKWWFYFMLILGVGFLLPEDGQIPVEGASASDWNPASFWYYPWGKSGTHKGVDIFAKRNTPVKAMASGLVIYQGELSRGGKVVLVLGPKWRFQYYAHLASVEVSAFSWLHSGQRLGSVGDSGNAKGKPPHLHFSLMSVVPYPWRIDTSPQGWKKMFYLNPTQHF
ncbi:MAG: M23 family metallopeptidase [Salibacteraceae bacterium]